MSVVDDCDMKTFTAIVEMETEGAISQAEYDIYTAICQETNLFLFHRPDTAFNDYTRDAPFHKYHSEQPRFSGAFKYKCLRSKGMIEDYEVKNTREWRLEKRFQVENGYRFASELEPQEFKKARGIFTLSRVGFSESCDYGLVHIAYSACGYSCGYYLLLHFNAAIWQRQVYFISYVV
ncbi:hypothetical protein [Nostoc sp.]|uniref:hypothetical protein n=1 Tax=Nostoc sp. TaxID=1180 RepID=UPI002FF86326